jgi:hypothetical protein
VTVLLLFALAWLAVELSPWVTAAGVVAAAALGALATVVVSRRQFSGSVDDTDARTLWDSLREMNRELRAELKAQKEEHRVEMAAARAEIQTLRGRVRELEVRLNAQ